ncbi:flocculation protein FLO11-like [Malania oleifera]|uniref:flocculation protein FLO11-like n=1 Tax=Malania oleifera TaxID=397392 RepID=UPI0025ADDED2|nr:flocculation protein FLO11-like [Malania oleifera]
MDDGVIDNLGFEECLYKGLIHTANGGGRCEHSRGRTQLPQLLLLLHLPATPAAPLATPSSKTTLFYPSILASPPTHPHSPPHSSTAVAVNSSRFLRKFKQLPMEPALHTLQEVDTQPGSLNSLHLLHAQVAPAYPTKSQNPLPEYQQPSTAPPSTADHHDSNSDPRTSGDTHTRPSPTSHAAGSPKVSGYPTRGFGELPTVPPAGFEECLYKGLIHTANGGGRCEHSRGRTQLPQLLLLLHLPATPAAPLATPSSKTTLFYPSILASPPTHPHSPPHSSTAVAVNASRFLRKFKQLPTEPALHTLREGDTQPGSLNSLHLLHAQVAPAYPTKSQNPLPEYQQPSTAPPSTADHHDSSSDPRTSGDTHTRPSPTSHAAGSPKVSGYPTRGFGELPTVPPAFFITSISATTVETFAFQVNASSLSYWFSISIVYIQRTIPPI